MATDYILFIHGVNTRQAREQPEYADGLFNLIQESVSDSKRELKKVALYWGDVNISSETQLLKQLQASPLWEQVWFREFREQQILQFAGDAALYISRHVGSKVVKELKRQTSEVLENPHPDDRLHFVTHSWGTVILFDVLFAGRWDDPEVPGHDEVMAIRDSIFGISGKDPNVHKGIEIASIHTMGSPVAIFNLTNVTDSSHDITPRLQQLLQELHQAREGKKLPWRNYVHPGDPIAYPLKELMTDLADGEEQFLDIQDLITYEAGLFDFLGEPFSQTALALLHGGDAHGSYWRSQKVSQEISSVIKEEALILV